MYDALLYPTQLQSRLLPQHADTQAATATIRGTSCEPPLTSSGTPARNDCEVWSAVRSSVAFADEGFAGRGCTHCWGPEQTTDTNTTATTATDTAATTTDADTATDSRTASSDASAATAGTATAGTTTNSNDSAEDSADVSVGASDGGAGPSSLPGVSRHVAALFLILVFVGLTVAIASTVGVWSRQHSREHAQAAAAQQQQQLEPFYVICDTRSEPDRSAPQLL
jgi:hypothetical protein